MTLPTLEKPSLHDLIASTPYPKLRAEIEKLTDEEIEAVLYEWPLWARPDQLPPPGPWLTWLLRGGRGSGKTRTGSEFVISRVRAGCRRIALIGQTKGDVRDTMIEVGDSGILNKNNAITANLLYENGIRIFIYPGMTHLKAAIFDGWALVGSANLDKMSLKINDEMNLATSHPEAVKDLIDKVFIPDFEKATELEGSFPEKWYDFFLETIADQL